VATSRKRTLGLHVKGTLGVLVDAKRKGESFTTENLTAKRSGTGISPMRWNEVVGQVVQKDYEEDELI